MSEDKIIVSVLPFENPANDAEKQFNDMAMKYYLDSEKRGKQNGITMWIANPDHVGHMYYCTAGWTSEGWRTYVRCMDAEQIIGFCDAAVGAEERLIQLVDKARLDMMKAAENN